MEQGDSLEAAGRGSSRQTSTESWFMLTKACNRLTAEGKKKKSGWDETLASRCQAQ